MKLLRNNKAFTIIEMIVVIAVLGILMLLAMPKFLGYTQDAKLTQIKNDIKAYEVAVESGLVDNEKFIDSWITVPQDEINIMNSSEKVLNKRGKTVKDLSGTNVFVDRTKVEVKSKLKGDFIWTPTGEVVYYDKNLGNISQGGDNGNNGGDNGTGGNDGEGPTKPETPTEPEKPTYPIIHPNGDKEDEDGTITKPDGTIIKPDGTQHKPNGDIVKPDGSIVKPDGTVIYPNGDIKDKDGIITSPDGTITKPDGTINKPDGTIIKPDGTVTYYMATDADFEWLSDTYNGYEFPGKGKGYWHYKYSSPKKMIIPSTIEGKPVTNYNFMFNGNGMEKVVSNNTSITSIENMFSGVVMEELDLTDFDTSSVVSMRSAFAHSKYKKITVSSKFNTSNVTNMEGMFYNSKIDSFDFSGFNTAKVVNMGNMFSKSNFKNLDLTSFNTSNVTDMIAMFSQTENLQTINVTSFNTSKVTDMSSMFSYTTAPTLDLSSFTFSPTVKTALMFSQAKTTIGYAKTNTEVNKLNSTTYKPTTLTFRVK